MMFIYAVLILMPALTLTADVAQLEQDLFHALDENGDNSITQTEAEDYLMSLDTDKDGKISKQELTTALDSVDPSFVGKETALYELFDRDSTTEVTKDDIDDVFKWVDGNGDGKISRQEFKAIFDIVLGHIG